MKPQAFVVMPYGRREVTCASLPGTNGSCARIVDFDLVWKRLIKPALEIAGCEAVRADSQVSAGDIRTDMFFELVTADFIVADLSLANPNVYYELGIRDAACPRGVFIVDGGWPIARAFDVAQHRSFQYKGALFELSANDETAPHDCTVESNQVEEATKELATVFSRAFSADLQGTGSPLYSHLPGLKPVNWESIDTSRSRYFGSLQNDWQERVRRAQELNRPGNILTIAQYAPTRVHRIRILLEAARALIGLEQIAAAEEILGDILQAAPDNIEAQLSLAIAHITRNEILTAERQLRSILRQREGDPMAGMALGYIYRLLWYLEWKGHCNVRERAKASWSLLEESIHSFYNVQRLHPEQYLSGYNALLLIAVAEKLFGDELKLPIAMMDRIEIAMVVRYASKAARQVAEDAGDYEAQFWTSVALFGLDMLEGRKDETLQGVRDACAVPSATLFNLRWLQERMKFLLSLEFESGTVAEALKVVETALHCKSTKHSWKRVILFRGYPIDRRDATKQLFPRHLKDKVEAEIATILDSWKIGKGDLAICTASTESDVFFGQACLDRHADVRLLILEPTTTDLAKDMRDPSFDSWGNQRSSLISRSEVWNHCEELGAAVDTTSAWARHSRWMLNTARVEAERSTTKNGQRQNGPRLCGLILSVGSLDIDDSEGPALFISEIRTSNRYENVVEVIDLTKLVNPATTATAN